MNRRGFLGLLTGAGVAAFDPERLLWVPGRKLISIPAAPRLVTDSEVIAIMLECMRPKLEKFLVMKSCTFKLALGL